MLSGHPAQLLGTLRLDVASLGALMALSVRNKAEVISYSSERRRTVWEGWVSGQLIRLHNTESGLPLRIIDYLATF